MITRLPARIRTISSASRPYCRSAIRCTHHIKSRPALALQFLTKPSNRQYTTPPPTSSPPIEPSKPLDLRSQLSPSPATPHPEPPTPQAPPKRSLRPLIYATIFLLLGLTAGQYTRLILAPPPLPLAGTHEDNLMIEYLTHQASRLPIVQSLSTDPNWTHHDAYTSLPPHERSHRLTTGALAGARAVGGYQRIFSNPSSGETVTVIWFGGAIAGWPGVTHGGVIATIFDETLGRCAIVQFPAKTGVTANLEIDYLKPVITNAFYVLRAVPDREGKSERKCWVRGRLETVDGRVCVEGKALFVVPRGYATRRIEGGF